MIEQLCGHLLGKCMHRIHILKEGFMSFHHVLDKCLLEIKVLKVKFIFFIHKIQDVFPWHCLYIFYKLKLFWHFKAPTLSTLNYTSISPMVLEALSPRWTGDVDWGPPWAVGWVGMMMVEGRLTTVFAHQATLGLKWKNHRASMSDLILC